MSKVDTLFDGLIQITLEDADYSDYAEWASFTPDSSAIKSIQIAGIDLDKSDPDLADKLYSAIVELYTKEK